MSEDKNKIIVIAGPTASGKSSLSVKLAKCFNTEIISADSMQVYRGMDIGTAKIKKDEMQKIPHHMIDIVDPDINYDVVSYKDEAKKIIQKLHSENKIPIICGGTGFYIQALLYDIDFKEENTDTEYRNYLSGLSNEKLYSMLIETDEESSKIIPMENTKRIIRALEYYHIHNEPISVHNRIESEKKLNPPYDILFFVLNDDRDKLYERINLRVDKMFSDGLTDEVLSLCKKGFRRNTTASMAIGYKEILDYFDGKTDLSDAKDKIKQNSRNYAKRQLTWFRREKNTIWINMGEGDPFDEIRKYIQNIWSI